MCLCVRNAQSSFTIGNIHRSCRQSWLTAPYSLIRLIQCSIVTLLRLNSKLKSFRRPCPSTTRSLQGASKGYSQGYPLSAKMYKPRLASGVPPHPLFLALIVAEHYRCYDQGSQIV